MYLEVLPAILFVIAIIAFFHYASKKGAKMLADQKKKIDSAHNAKAKIISIDLGSMRGSGDQGQYQVYVLKLNVFPEYGNSYEAKTNWKVYQMGIPDVQPGKEVKVKIDANDSSIIYPAMQWVEHSFSTIRR